MRLKKVGAVCFVVLLLVSVSFVVFEATIQGGIKDDFVSTKQSFADGSGTEDDPYMIYDVHDLQGMIADLEAYYALANDIDASETTEWNDGAGFEPIGKYSVLTPYREPFIGSFDGRNHTITGLYIYRPSRRHVGFFGDVAEEGEVRNVGVIDVNITGAREVGGLVGGNYGMVENSYVSGNVSGNTYVGGLVGENSGTVTNSHYNIDKVVINGEHHITRGGIFDEQYNDWLDNDLYLDIGNYNETLVPSGDHYEISNVDGLRDLLGFAGREGYRFKLVADIDLSDVSCFHIPYLAAEFDGNRHIISGLNIDIPFVANVGMFGYVATNGYINNTGIVDPGVSGMLSYTGGLVGDNRGTVNNSYVTGTVTGYRITGGLVGLNYGMIENSYIMGDIMGDRTVGALVGDNRGIVSNSYATGSVTGGYGSGSLGGLVGDNRGTVSNSRTSVDVETRGYQNHGVGGLVGGNSGTVSNSYATGDVTGIGTYISVGGLVGSNSGTVSNSCATGTVKAQGNYLTRILDAPPHRYAGGLIGSTRGGIVSNSYATGDVTGNDGAGGLVGRNWQGSTVSNSYATGNVSGDIYVGGLIGIHEDGKVFNSHYNIDNVWINGDYHITLGGLYDLQYQDWVSNNFTLNITQYSDTLTPNDGYYEISEVQGLRDLLGFAGIPEYTFKLSQDINISTSSGLYIPYLAAEFDGNGYVISGLNIDIHFGCNVGMFGYVSDEGEVRNLGVTDAYINGRTYVGGLVGQCRGGTIDNSYSTGEVSGDWQVGGLVGRQRDGMVENSYATGTVSGDRDVGGLLGRNWNGTVENSYATGTVSGEQAVGGLVGMNIGTVSNSFWDIETSGQTGSAGGEGKSTTEMMDITTFSEVGWNITAVDNKDDRDPNYIWNIVDNQTYPFFSWQEVIFHPEFTLEILTEGSGTTDPRVGKHTYNYGQEVVIEAIPDEGWYFSHWSGDVPEGQEENEEITIVMDGDKELTAHFDQIYYNLTIAVEGNGTTNPPVGNHTYNYGQGVVVEAIPAEGWYFSHWIGGVPEGDETNENITVIMDDNKTLTAQFQQIYYNLSIAVEGEGNTVPEEGNHSYAHGTERNITAIPDKGWYFSHWSGDVPEGEEYDEEITITMDDDISLTAHFERREFNLNISINGEGTTTPSVGDHTYLYEDEVNVTAVADEGWYFSHWTGDVADDEVYNENITVFMDDNKTLTAHFDEIIPPTVNITSFDDGTVFDNDEVTVEWEAVEGTYSIDRYELRLNDGEWIDVGTETRYTFEGLEDGEYNVTVRVVDSQDNDQIVEVDFTVDTGANMFWLIFSVILVGTVSLAIFVLIKNGTLPILNEEEDAEEDGEF